MLLLLGLGGVVVIVHVVAGCDHPAKARREAVAYWRERGSGWK